MADHLTTDLAAFPSEPRDCGELDTGMTEREPGARVGHVYVRGEDRGAR